MCCPQQNWVPRCKRWHLISLALGLTVCGSLQAFDTGLPERRKKQTDFIHTELKVVVDEFGSDAERIPTDFLEKVRRWARLYETRDRSDMAKVLESQRDLFDRTRQESAGTAT